MHRRTFLAAGVTASVGPFAAAQRLDRKNLLQYRDERARVMPVRTVNDWLRRRAEIVAGMQQVMGPLPGPEKRCPLDIQTHEEAERGSHLLRRISYAPEPGGRVPAYLLIPKRLLTSQAKASAILCLHPTDHKIGHKVVVGLGGMPNRQYAEELAERGYVTLAPSYPLLADYQPELKALGYQSGTMKAVWDNIRGLDVLESLPFVRKGAFATIGHSLGGHNSVYTSIFDKRLSVVVSSCGIDSYLDYKDGDIRGWTSERYMPGLLEYRNRLSEIPFDFHEMIGALAPRVCFISAPLKDDNFKWKSVDEIVEAARPVYKLYGKPENLIAKHPDCAHDFPDDMRQVAYSLFERHLGR
jgi:hypothetical protein